MKRALGNWVTDERFWDREGELELFIEYLEAGANVLLTAPRRIGKTSLMREAAARVGDKFLCLQVDLQKCHNAADAVVQLSIAIYPHQNLWAKASKIFGELYSRITGTIDSIKVSELTIKLRGELSETDWQTQADKLLDVLATAEQPVIVFLDEVPILVNRILQGADYRITEQRRKDADAFMSWIREATIRHQGKIRLVVTGSIGFEPVLRAAELNATLNTFTPFSIGAWQPETAVSFLLKIATSYGLSLNETTAARMIQNLGYCIPHYVQVYFDNVYRACRLRHLNIISLELVDEVYKTQMLSVQGHVELSHLEERLKTVLGPELHPFALELLSEVAVVGVLTQETAAIISRGYCFNGRSQTEVLRQVLGILEHDLYIVKSTDSQEYRPVSKLVSDWWKARFAFTYVPALERKGLRDASASAEI